MGKFIIESGNGYFSFSLKAANGETVGTGKFYTSKQACIKAVGSVAKCAVNAGFLNLLPEDNVSRITANPKFEMFHTENNCYSFILRARNGDIILFGGNYKSKQGCLNGIESVRKNSADHEIVEYLSGIGV